MGLPGMPEIPGLPGGPGGPAGPGGPGISRASELTKWKSKQGMSCKTLFFK